MKLCYNLQKGDAMSITPDELINGERKFLHDLSNHLVVAQGMGNFVLSSLNKTMPEDAKELQRMGKAMNAVDKIIDLLRERRDFIKSYQD